MAKIAKGYCKTSSGCKNSKNFNQSSMASI